MTIIGFSIRRPVTITMIFLAAVVFGFVALGRLDLRLLPEISYPTLTVQTEYADAAPLEVENFVTRPLEEAVGVVSGLRDIRSVSKPGMSEITLEFAWDSKMDYSALDVREKIDLIELPKECKQPVILRYDPSLDPVVRLGVYGTDNLVRLRYVADRTIKRDLESLEGVASAKVLGGLEEEIQVELDEKKLASLGIPITDVSSRLLQDNINQSGGRLRDAGSEFLLRTENEFKDLDDIRNTIVAQEEGRKIVLADLGHIVRGHREREVITRINGEEAVEIAVYKEGSANTVEVSAHIRAMVERLKEELPEEIKLVLLFDQARFIKQAIAEVRSNAILGALLAVIVLFLFLRDLRSTFIIGLSIPISVMATFFLMRQLGVSLNLMSLGGLALGIGMLVDNSIVVLENISRRKEQGLDRRDATYRGASEVGRAVIASTLTTVAVFIPIVFVEGIAGQVFRDQALTVSISLLASLMVALMLIPMISAFKLRGAPPVQALNSGGAPQGGPAPESAPPKKRGLLNRILLAPFRLVAWILRSIWRFILGPIFRLIGRFVVRPVGRFILRPLARFVLRPVGRYVLAPLWKFLTHILPVTVLKVLRKVTRWLGVIFGLLLRLPLAWFGGMFNGVSRAYVPVLNGALRHRALFLFGAFLLFGLTLFAGRFLGAELIPQFYQGEFNFNVRLPEGSALSSTDKRLRTMEEIVSKDDAVETYFTTVGQASRLGSNTKSKDKNLGQLNVVLKDKGNRRQEDRVVENLRRRFAEISNVDVKFSRPMYFTMQTPIEVEVYGYNLEKLRQVADQLERDLAEIPGIKDVKSSMEVGNPELNVVFDRERLSALGLNLDEVSNLLKTKIQGEVPTKFKERELQVDIRVRTAAWKAEDVSELSSLVVGEREGVPISLSTVADIDLARGLNQISRISQQRAAVVTGNLAGRDLGSVSGDIQKVIDERVPPAGITMELGGQNQELNRSFRSLMFALLLAVFLVYLVMAAQFESFVHPFIILFTVPLGAIGVVWTLMLTGKSLSIVVLIGGIMLSGIVVNNAIVLIDCINGLRREGMKKLDAIREAGQIRLRPIIMTTMTTVLGLLPMALGLGEGAEIRSPMALTVIGGLLGATFLTLLVIPALYAVVDRGE